MRIAVILSAHENSPTYRDTLESVKTHLSDDVVVLADGFGAGQFDGVDLIEGFRHGKSSAPVRNVALGLMGAWERWGGVADWYCYIEYDCLVGSGEVREHLGMADERGYWMLGNDMRSVDRSMPFLDRLEGGRIPLRYLLGCCWFMSSAFMGELARRRFFTRLLEYTNFFDSETVLLEDASGKGLPAHDPSEFIYPSLAVHYGGTVEQLACWDGGWSGNYHHYPMRFKPDLSESDPFRDACVMHPVKDPESPLRRFHGERRRGLKS